VKPEPANLFDAPCPTCGGTGRISHEQLRRMIEDKPGAVGKEHPPTAQRAARRKTNIEHFGTQRYRALYWLAGHTDATAAETAPYVKVSRNQCATRLGELREDGLVEWVRDERGDIITRPTGPRDDGQVQRITALGLTAYQNAVIPDDPA
jgi:hypothetical protein